MFFKKVQNPIKKFDNEDLLSFHGARSLCDHVIKQTEVDVHIKGTVLQSSQTFTREVNEDGVPIGVDQLKFVMVTKEGLKITVEKT